VTKVRQHIETLFAPSEQTAAERMLAPLLGQSDRVLLAAVRLSNGDLPRLRQAVELGQRDWRDLLVAAGFADDVGAHERWVPRKVTPEILERWASGEAIEGVEFLPNARVQYRRVALTGAMGTVRALLALEPEPAYSVLLDSGREGAVPQSNLRPVD
jgi:hypothetical protein